MDVTTANWLRFQHAASMDDVQRTSHYDSRVSRHELKGVSISLIPKVRIQCDICFLAFSNTKCKPTETDHQCHQFTSLQKINYTLQDRTNPT
jgi:hypothetical protein